MKNSLYGLEMFIIIVTGTATNICYLSHT